MLIALSCFLRYPIIEDARALLDWINGDVITHIRRQANEAAHRRSPHITSL